jgi:hypothetical protein
MSSEGFPLLVLQPMLGPGAANGPVCVCSVPKLGRCRGLCNGCSASLPWRRRCPGLVCLLPASAIARLDVAALPAGMRIAAGLVPLPDSGPAQIPLPHTLHGKGPTQVMLLKILAQITGDAETRDIEATLKQDPQLSVQLLRLVNSVAFAPNGAHQQLRPCHYHARQPPVAALAATVALRRAVCRRRRQSVADRGGAARRAHGGTLQGESWRQGDTGRGIHGRHVLACSISLFGKPLAGYRHAAEPGARRQ